MYIYTLSTSVLRGHRRVLEPLGLELYIVVQFHMGSSNQTWVLWKSGCKQRLFSVPPVLRLLVNNHLEA